MHKLLCFLSNTTLLILKSECRLPGVVCKERKFDWFLEPEPILELSNLSLSGTISADLGLLSDLIHLDMSFNSLKGTLPESIECWSQLTHLDLSFNSLKGTLPESIKRWSQLTHFDVFAQFFDWQSTFVNWRIVQPGSICAVR
jgi:Leucine Rich Repeat